MRSLVVPAVGLVGSGLLYLLLLYIRWTSSRDRRRSPLTRDLLRSPGQSIRDRMESKSLDILGDVFGLLMWPVFLALGIAVTTGSRSPGWGFLSVALLVLMVGEAFLIVRVFRGVRERMRLKLGLDGEMATGEELNQLMLHGCRVFHDFPAERFNIDHVVIGPGGVYAVETKARTKPTKGAGGNGAKVSFDGERLIFPGWQERGPVEQAKHQANWLARWLTSAVGEPVEVRPALALPGWYIERKAPDGPLVFNPRNPVFLAKPPRGQTPLSDQLIQRIAHQIEQRCRDVEPLAYRDREAKNYRAAATSDRRQAAV